MTRLISNINDNRARYVAPVEISSSLIVTGSTNITGSTSITGSLSVNGLRYPLVDNGEFSFFQSDGLGNVTLQYVNTLYEVVYNAEATSIVKGTPLYVSGSQGANSKVYRADAGIPSKMPVTYIAADNIASSETGRGIVLGLITGVDTTGYPAGTEVYVAVGGGWTSIRPTGSAIVQVLGIVTKEGSGGQGLVLNPGPANLPNLNSGSIWVGNSGSFPTSISTASLSVATASYVNTLRQNVILSGSLTARQTGFNASGIFTGDTIGAIALTTTASNGFSIFTTAGTLQVFDNTNASNRIYIDNSGNVGIGTTPNATLNVRGTVRVDTQTGTPATPATPGGTPTDYYGTDGTKYLGEPSTWLKINLDGADYYIAAYE